MGQFNGANDPADVALEHVGVEAARHKVVEQMMQEPGVRAVGVRAGDENVVGPIRHFEVAVLQPFDEAYAATDWSRFKSLPAFDQANRINAWGTYLRMEQEALGKATP